MLPQIAQAVDLIAAGFARGGRLIYVGTGTSGRIGALDASECPPTFGTSPEMVEFLIAGGEEALIHATEASEDSAELGRQDMARKRPGKRDVIVGLAASGFTPYTISALQYAKSKGAATVGVACNRGSRLGKIADISIEVEVGPEVLTGSSRLKAGTAQKLICNMLTTAAMARVGYVSSNLMVNLILKNKKLEQRGIAILEALAGGLSIAAARIGDSNPGEGWNEVAGRAGYVKGEDREIRGCSETQQDEGQRSQGDRRLI